MKNKVNIAGTGLVYRNPKPHLRSIVGYHPSLTVFSETEFLATFDLGQAVEALDYHTCVARSHNGGESWVVEGPLLPDPAPPLTTHSVRTSRLADGSLVGFGGFYHRRGEDEDLVNRDTFGLVPVELFTVRSFDKGRSWTAPRVIETPLIGPSWEICHPIVELADGRWLAPTSTWRDWDANDYEGDRAVVLISDDQGGSWPDYGCSFDGRETKLSYLEQSVIQLQDGSILGVSWVYETETGGNRPTAYALSTDRGQSFSEPAHTGFVAQTCKVIQLSDGRLLCVYRRNDRPGLWAHLARLDGDRWINLGEAPLWEGAESGMSGRTSGAEELSSLKFGHPSLRQIGPDQVLVLFWCQENCLTNIRWIKLRLS